MAEIQSAAANRSPESQDTMERSAKKTKILTNPPSGSNSTTVEGLGRRDETSRNKEDVVGIMALTMEGVQAASTSNGGLPTPGGGGISSLLSWEMLSWASAISEDEKAFQKELEMASDGEADEGEDEEKMRRTIRLTREEKTTLLLPWRKSLIIKV